MSNRENFRSLADEPLYKPTGDLLPPAVELLADCLARSLQQAAKLQQSKIFSVIGDRGDGKSSLLRLLKAKLERAGGETRVVLVNAELIAGYSGLTTDGKEHSVHAVLGAMLLVVLNDCAELIDQHQVRRDGQRSNTESVRGAITKLLMTRQEAQAAALAFASDEEDYSAQFVTAMGSPWEAIGRVHNWLLPHRSTRRLRQIVVLIDDVDMADELIRPFARARRALLEGWPRIGGVSLSIGVACSNQALVALTSSPTSATYSLGTPQAIRAYLAGEEFWVPKFSSSRIIHFLTRAIMDSGQDRPYHGGLIVSWFWCPRRIAVDMQGLADAQKRLLSMFVLAEAKTIDAVHLKCSQEITLNSAPKTSGAYSEIVDIVKGSDEFEFDELDSSQLLLYELLPQNPRRLVLLCNRLLALKEQWDVPVVPIDKQLDQRKWNDRRSRILSLLVQERFGGTTFGEIVNTESWRLREALSSSTPSEMPAVFPQPPLDHDHSSASSAYAVYVQLVESYQKEEHPAGVRRTHAAIVNAFRNVYK